MSQVMSYKANLNKVKNVNDFIVETTKYENEVRVQSEEGYVVNGKSIMGLFSLDLEKNVKILVEFNNESELKAFVENLKQVGITLTNEKLIEPTGKCG